MTEWNLPISREELHKRFEYREDGEVIRKFNPDARPCENAKYANKVTGKIDSTGYKVLSIGSRATKVSMRAHRVIFGLVHGYVPELVDHKDGNPLNNRIENLRPATIQENARNRRVPDNNSSGVIGVWFEKSRNKWNSQITIDGVKTRIGRFEKFEDAVAARKEAEKIHFGEFVRGHNDNVSTRICPDSEVHRIRLE